MGEYPADLKYTREHEWAKKAGNTVQIGVTWHAQDALGAIVYVELPKVGTQIVTGQSFGVVESAKSVSELFAPLNGKVVKINDEVVSNPGAINDDPYKAGWMIEVEPANPSEFDGLMSAAAYTAMLETPK